MKITVCSYKKTQVVTLETIVFLAKTDSLELEDDPQGSSS